MTNIDETAYSQAKFDFRLYCEGRLTSFTADLFRAIQHADFSNREKLRLGFPVHVTVVEDWEFSDDPDRFLQENQL